jgi:DNA-binding MurR/RpiR family transcriptional regulator
MPDPSVLELITKRYRRLTEAKRRVADYIAGRIDDIAFMTVDELAAAAGVSPATVVRFAGELGFDGYAGLNSELRGYIRRHLGPLRGVEEPLEADSPAGAFRAALQRDQEVLGRLATRLDNGAVTAATERILAARRVWVVGFRSSLSAAALLAWGFQLIRGDVDLFRAEDYLPERLLDASARDVLVAFSFARYYRSTVKVVQWAAQRGVGVVVISDSPVSTAARLADTVLTIPYRSRGIPGFTVVGTVGVVNGLLAAAATQMSAAQKARMVKRIEEAETAQSAWAFWDLGTEAGSR